MEMKNLKTLENFHFQGGLAYEREVRKFSFLGGVALLGGGGVIF